MRERSGKAPLYKCYFLDKSHLYSELAVGDFFAGSN